MHVYAFHAEKNIIIVFKQCILADDLKVELESGPQIKRNYIDIYLSDLLVKIS